MIMVFCITKVKNARLLDIVTLNMEDIVIPIVQLQSLCLSLELEQFLGAKRGS